jgi:hypothetical protein
VTLKASTPHENVFDACFSQSDLVNMGIEWGPVSKLEYTMTWNGDVDAPTFFEFLKLGKSMGVSIVNINTIHDVPNHIVIRSSLEGFQRLNATTAEDRLILHPHLGRVGQLTSIAVMLPSEERADKFDMFFADRLQEAFLAVSLLHERPIEAQQGPSHDTQSNPGGQAIY